MSKVIQLTTQIKLPDGDFIPKYVVFNWSEKLQAYYYSQKNQLYTVTEEQLKEYKMDLTKPQFTIII